MVELGFKGLDINMGCFVFNVVGNGKGSGFICCFEVVVELI